MRKGRGSIRSRGRHSSTPPPPSSLLEGHILAGRYRLVREMAHGGMGSVWEARHEGLDTPVALKFMHPSAMTCLEAHRRFEGEAKRAARLGRETDYVVKIFDFGVERGIPYIAMELLQGEDIGKKLGREGRLSSSALAPLVAQIAVALRKAHGLGIVHRDLKPENIFLCARDEEERVKLLDFGISKQLGSKSSPETKQALGTPHYMSPEQLRNQGDIDHRSDLWSLGVVLYRAVVGALPFDGMHMWELAYRILGEPAPLPSEVDAELPEEVDEFFARALARDPEARFSSAEEMAQEFARVARVSWHPPTSSDRPTNQPHASRQIDSTLSAPLF